jgi:hypothetical protein
MQSAAGTLFGLAFATRKPFALLFQRLRGAMDAAEAQAAESCSACSTPAFHQLNAEYGFAFSIGAAAPDAGRYRAELELIAQSYGRYVGF